MKFLTFLIAGIRLFTHFEAQNKLPQYWNVFFNTLYKSIISIQIILSTEHKVESLENH